MSGESAAGYAVAVVGGSAWLAARGIEAGALVAARSVDLLGAGLVRVGKHAEQTRAQWESSHAAMLAWEAAAREVIGVNARLDVLRATPELSDDLRAALPAPLRPCAESPEQLWAWCTVAGDAATAVERELAARTSQAVLAVLSEIGESSAQPRPITAEEAFARYRQGLAEQAAQRREAPSAVIETVARIVARLPAEAGPADRAAVLAAAAQVTAQRPDADHDTLLDELRLRVQRAGDRARTRREDALLAARMLQALPGDTVPDLPPVRTALSEVVAGQRAMDRELRERAERAIEQVRAQLERDYVRQSLIGALTELGYAVDEGFGTLTANPDRIRLVHADWDGHAVQVVVGSDDVKAAVVRLDDRVGTDARRVDAERERQWCQDLNTLRTSLVRAGVRLVQRHLVLPGERVLPVVRRRDAPVAERRGRQRKRPS